MNVKRPNIDCEQWLYELLKNEGHCLCNLVRDEAKNQGYSKAELKAARKKLGVKTWHQFEVDGSSTQNWFWFLD